MLSEADKGIKWDRSCTDIFCCGIFIAFMISMGALTVYGMTNGDPIKIITPFDSVGNECGQKDQGPLKEDFSLFKYKHFTSISPILTSNAVCV
jgi:hypothetical protein